MNVKTHAVIIPPSLHEWHFKSVAMSVSAETLLSVYICQGVGANFNFSVSKLHQTKPTDSAFKV